MLVQSWLAVLNQKPTARELMQEITRCLSLTASRSRDQADLKLMLAALSDELQDMPADLLRAGLRKWARQEKWWPTLNEIIVAAQSAGRRRQNLAFWIGLDEKSQRFWIDHYSRH